MRRFRISFPTIQTLAITGVIMLSIGQSACEKKRGLRYTQGSGDNLFDIKQYDGLTFKIKTGAKRFKGQTSRADELVTLQGFDKINNLDAVEFGTTEGLFADIDISDFNFYGRENFEYTLKYTLTDQNVILSKIGTKADIPSQELTYAKDLGGDQFEVPLMGLPISLFKVEKVQDDRGKPTRSVAPFRKDHLDEATHFKINEGLVKYFESPAKPDLFSADFFNPTDEWFYTKTLVGRAINSREILGETAASLKIKFARTNNSLLGVDINIAKEQEVLDPTKTITALEIPVQWVDFKTDTAGSYALLREKALGDRENTSRFWKERKYALLDFNNADRLDKAFTLDNKLEKLEVSNDYISFTIYESSSGNTYKYSLVKSNRKVDGQNLFADDATLFHLFTERRVVIRGALQDQGPDIDKLVYANRFYPENGEIVYHLSKNSPTDVEFTEATKTAIKAWDDAFQTAGTGVRVRLADEKVDVGDARYNTIVLYGYEIDAGSLLGFGPSVQDSRTGQTFAAASHIYLRSYREMLIENIRSFIRNELGVYADKGVAGIPSFAVSENFVAAGGLVGRSDANIGGMGNLAEFIRGSGMFNAQLSSDDYLKKVFRSDSILADIDAYSEQQTSGSGKDVFFTANGPACKFASPASLTVSWDRIRATCLADKKLGTYVARLKELHAANSSILNTDGEDEAILECAQPLMQDLLSATLIHEIGHNLGLGHNFAGTSDTEDNFAKNDDGSIAFASSSVMDYMDRPSYFNTKVGPYDVAAIRFLYSRKVETKDGEFLDVPKNSSILSAVANQGKTLKPFKMCTDQEVPPSTGLPLYDPMCGRGEMGSTPEKYVKWVISKIHADLIQNGYRYNDKAFVGPSVGYLDRLKQVQEYFRYLIRGSAGAYLENLTGSTPAEKKAALEAMIAATPEADRALVESYYKAVNLIFDFGREFMALPTRVCLIQDNAGIIVDALEFAPLRQRIFDKSRVTVQNCKQAYGYAAAALTSMGKTYVADLGSMKFLDRGLEINGLELDLDPASAANKLKQIAFGSRGVDLDPSYSSGSIRLKNKVIEMLTSRKSVLKLAADSGVGGSNFLDYEWFAAALYSDAWQNLLSGTKGELLDATLLAGKTFQLYEDTVNLAPFYLFTLYSNGLNTRSRSYSYALAMRPRKERSLSIFSQGPGATENPIWYVTNTANEVLYADTGIAKSIIQLLVRMEQFQKSKVIHDATHAADTAEILNTLTASVTSMDAALAVDEKLYQTALGYLGTKGLTVLQPAQKALLRQRLATAKTGAENLTEAGSQAAIVLKGLAEFSDKDLLDQRLLSMVNDGSNSFSALQASLNTLINSF